MSGSVMGAGAQAHGTIFDVQRYSLHDGPGLRTNVFLKGCGLRCRWCSNPESQRAAPEVAFFERDCFLCGDCLAVCTAGAIQLQAERLLWEPSKCDGCGRCVKACPSRAFRLLGRDVTAGEVLADVLRDAAFYQGQGGLTLTGGEPALQPDFAQALLVLARGEGLHTALETCGFAPWPSLERLLPYLDLVLFDLKHVDARLHRRMTGASSRPILDNLLRVARTAAGHGRPQLVLRVPLIPGFNADEFSLHAIAAYARDLPGLQQVHLLPYHTLGQVKYRALGRPYALDGVPPMKVEEAERLADIFRQAGFQVVVGG